MYERGMRLAALMLVSLSSCAAGSSPVVVPHAERVIGALRADFRACYLGEARLGLTTTGSVRFNLRVDSEGHVVSATARDAVSLSESAVHCLTVVLEGARFGAPGAEATLHVPIYFHPLE